MKWIQVMSFLVTLLISSISSCILWDETSPAEIHHVDIAEIWSTGVRITWEDPDDFDFKEIILSYDALDPPVPIVIPKGTFEIVVVDLPENEREYRLLLQTVDYKGNESEGTPVFFTPYAKPRKITRWEDASTELWQDYYFYDAPTGLLEMRKRYNIDDELQGYSKYMHDNIGRVQIVSNYSTGTILESRIEYTYAVNRRIETLRYYTIVPQEGLQHYETYEYDLDGHLLTVYRYDSTDRLTVTKAFQYDIHWRQISYTVTYHDHDLVYTGRFEYEQDTGNKAKETYRDFDDNVVWFETYDTYIATQ